MVNYNCIIYSVNNSNIEFYESVLSKLQCNYNLSRNHLEFESLLKNKNFDLAVLDLELDNTDAISVVKEVALQEKKPLLVICSTKSDDFILVSSLNSGADNFITLPINPLVFELKLKALLKRVKKDKSEEDIFFLIDREQFKIILNKVTHYLPKLEFNLLDLLSSEPNKVFSKQEIANTLWHDESVSNKRTIDIHIRNIRKELGNNTIKTLRGIGYSINIKK
jgi:two-component system alkaline phosphatase synthesis response regulator PhoP